MPYLLAKPLERILRRDVHEKLVKGLDTLLELGDLWVDVGRAERDVDAVRLNVAAGRLLVRGHAKRHDHRGRLDGDARLGRAVDAEVDDLAACVTDEW